MLRPVFFFFRFRFQEPVQTSLALVACIHDVFARFRAQHMYALTSESLAMADVEFSGA